MDGWMDIIRVGVCVGMCKYWVIILDILDILACGGAKCFRGMNPSLILLTSISHPSCRPSFFSSSPPTTHHPFIIHHASRYLLSTRTTMAHHGSTGLTILLDRVQATIEYTSLTLPLSLSIRMIDVLEMSSLLAQHRCHSWNRHATRRGLDGHGHGHGGRPRLGQLAGERHNAAENRPRC